MNDDVAWAAGVFEGEGAATISGRGRPHLAIRTTDEWTARRVADILGGVVYGPYSNDYADGYVRKPVFMWKAAGDLAFSVAWTLYTYLSPRRQARIRELFAS